jgi:V/A-type H+-transporting ATPase subunit E
MDVKDGLIAITNEVLGDVQKEAENIIHTAEGEAKNTLNTAKQQAEQNYTTVTNQAKIRAEAEKRKIASLTEVDVRNRLLQTKEELVDAAFQGALRQLGDFTETEAYQTYLLKLIEHAAKRIGAKNLIVQVNAKDKVWLTKEVLRHLSGKLNVEMTLSDLAIECIGGCKMQTQDGSVSVDDTIDNRLQELKPTLRTQIAKILFEEAQ